MTFSNLNIRSIMTRSIKTLNITAFCIINIRSIMTLSIMTLSITTFNINVAWRESA
jgi:hypothetical protein